MGGGWDTQPLPRCAYLVCSAGGCPVAQSSNLLHLSLSSWEKGREVTVPMRSIPCGWDGSEHLMGQQEWWQEEGAGGPGGQNRG